MAPISGYMGSVVNTDARAAAKGVHCNTKPRCDTKPRNSSRTMDCPDDGLSRGQYSQGCVPPMNATGFAHLT